MTSQNFRIFCIVILVSVFCFGNATRLRKLGDLGLVMDLIDQQYIEEPDQQALYEAAMTGLFSSLDPYSAYIPRESLKPFQAVLEQQFGGLGIRIEGPPMKERLTIVSTLFDSPAYRAGVKPGDIILEVDGVEVSDREPSQVTDLLRGKEGTVALLKLERSGVDAPVKLSVPRARIEVESVLGDQRRENGSWDFALQADPSVGYFHIEVFGDRTAKELAEAVRSLKDPRGLILDLRDNTGGLLNIATDIADMFLEDGPIVTTRSRHGVIDEQYDATPGAVVAQDIPIAVIINEQSASASEILAAALQDRNRATVVGARSFGKGNVQNVIPLEGGQAAMRLTTAYYFPPNGRKIHRRKDAPPEEDWGVLPSPGYEVTVDDEGLKVIYERFRNHADPLFVMPTPSPDEKNAYLRRDPTLRDDPQLMRALDAIDARATKPHVDN